jgi:hypothetical protein
VLLNWRLNNLFLKLFAITSFVMPVVVLKSRISMPVGLNVTVPLPVFRMPPSSESEKIDPLSTATPA